eukprot:s842_g6.t2
MPGIQGDDFDSLTTRQLRKECASRAIDLAGCFDKDAILQRLRQALTDDRRRDAAAGRHSDVAPEATSEAPRPDREDVENVASSHEREADARPGQGDEPSAEAPRPDREDVENVASSHEWEADARPGQGDGDAPQATQRETTCLDWEADARPGQGDGGASQASEKRPADSNIDIEAEASEASYEVFSNDLIKDSNQFPFSKEKWKMEKQLKTCAKWAASEEIAAAAKRGLALNSSKLADRSALEAPRARTWK